MTHRTSIALAMFAALAAASGSAFASFHFMQIEQVIGGVNGDVERQAVQLRMRAGGQNEVGNTQIVAYDAAGANPIVLIDFPNGVPVATAGSRILIATAKFATQPEVLADFVADAPIPESYLDAGRLTFEGAGGFVYWSLCWGGTGYTGSTGGSNTNDADGEFGPCVAGPLQASSREALLFGGALDDLSSSNIVDYAVTAGAASFTNNAGDSAAVTEVVVYVDGFDR